MKILLIGAKGRLGTRLKEVLTSDKDIAIVPFTGDATDVMQIKSQAAGTDVIVSTVGVRSVDELVKVAENVITAATELGIRVVWSGGAASLVQKDGTRVLDIPESQLPPEWIPAIAGHAREGTWFV